MSYCSAHCRLPTLSTHHSRKGSMAFWNNEIFVGFGGLGLVVAAVLYFTGSGPFQPCVTNGFGVEYCGEEAKTYCRTVSDRAVGVRAHVTRSWASRPRSVLVRTRRWTHSNRPAMTHTGRRPTPRKGGPRGYARSAIVLGMYGYRMRSAARRLTLARKAAQAIDAGEPARARVRGGHPCRPPRASRFKEAGRQERRRARPGAAGCERPESTARTARPSTASDDGATGRPSAAKDAPWRQDGVRSPSRRWNGRTVGPAKNAGLGPRGWAGGRPLHQRRERAQRTAKKAGRSAQDGFEAALERAGERVADRALLEALDQLGEEALDDEPLGGLLRSARASAGRRAGRGRSGRSPPRGCSGRRWRGSRGRGSRRRAPSSTAAGCATPGSRRSAGRPRRP